MDNLFESLTKYIDEIKKWGEISLIMFPLENGKII